jgi:hypothetical protein
LPPLFLIELLALLLGAVADPLSPVLALEVLLLDIHRLQIEGGSVGTAPVDSWPFDRPVEPRRHLHAEEVCTGDCLDARDVGRQGV